MGTLSVKVIDLGEEMEISKKDRKELRNTCMVKTSTYKGEVSVRLAIYNKDGQQVSLDGRVPYIDAQPGTPIELDSVKLYKKETDEGYYLLAVPILGDEDEEDEEEEEEEEEETPKKKGKK